jgi:hypothetical protein
MEAVGRFLAGPFGSALRVAAGFVLAAVLATVQAGSVAELGELDWWQATLAGAIGVAVPLVIAALNPEDPRFGRGAE